MQKQGIREQDEVNPELVELAKKLGRAGSSATNDVHFLNKEDHYAHDVLCCISMGKLITDENRLKYPTELYLKSPQEMAAALGQFPGGDREHGADRADVQSGAGFLQAVRAGLPGAGGEAGPTASDLHIGRSAS